MTDLIRWGVVATGHIAANFVSDLALVDDAEVLAVGSRSDDTAARFATTNNISRPYGTWEALAADPDVDIVYVAGPHPAHYPAARLMLTAGKAVLCEKPLTLNAAQAEDLVAIAHEQRVFLAEGMWTRTIPALRRIVELVANGAIGEVTAVAADFSFPSGAGPENRLFNPALGGGALLDVGVYPLALAQLFLGTPDTITGTARLTDQGVDAGTGMLLGYQPGREDTPPWRGDTAFATLSCAVDSSNSTTATIAGTAGRIDIPPGFHHPRWFVLHRGTETEQIDVPFEGTGLRFQAIEAMRCLRHGHIESPLLPHSATLAVLGTMDEVRRQIGVRYPDEAVVARTA